MPRIASRSRPALPIVLALAAVTSAACQGSGGDDQGSGFRISFSSSASPAPTDAVFVRLNATGGALITLDVVGRSIGAPLDEFQIALAFDPVVLQASSVSSSTFLGECGATRPDNTVLICADSIASGAANSSGVLLFSAVPQGGSPTPVSVTGEVVLASLTFRARSAGLSSVYFHDGSNPGPGGLISRVVSSSDPSGAAAVLFEPALPGITLIEVRRS